MELGKYVLSVSPAKGEGDILRKFTAYWFDKMYVL